MSVRINMSDYARGTKHRHTKLRDALLELQMTRKVQVVELPADRKPVYYQKYAHMLAGRGGFRIRTGLKVSRGQAFLLIQESAF